MKEKRVFRGIVICTKIWAVYEPDDMSGESMK